MSGPLSQSLFSEGCMVEYHFQELDDAARDDYKNVPPITMFVHKDLTPECLFKLCDADCAGRTSHTEFICHDEFAAFADQFGMMGAKARADESRYSRPGALVSVEGRGVRTCS